MHVHAVALLLSHVALAVSAQTAPYTSSAFQSVMDLSKLQESGLDEDVYLPELTTYASDNFQLVDGDTMQFSMEGYEERCELRERTSDDENAAWSVSGSHEMSGSVAIPSQESGITEVTVSQIHCDSNPPLRFAWIDEQSSDDCDCTDCVIAHVRQGSSDDDVAKYYLMDRSSSFTSYKIWVESSQLYVSIAGTTMVDGADISYWESEDCYFKAGVYNTNPTDTSATAVAQFSSLDW